MNTLDMNWIGAKWLFVAFIHEIRKKVAFLYTTSHK
jgi:hypothetical protein